MSITILFILLSLFVVRTIFFYKKEVGLRIYTAFSGWQIASNALNGYAHAPRLSDDKVPLEFRDLHKIVNIHMDSLRNIEKRGDTALNSYYLWDEKSPLHVYKDNKYPSNISEFKKWASMSVLYQNYGVFLIKKFPGEYLEFNLLPNFHYYLEPNPEYLTFYNTNNKNVGKIIQLWFNYDNGEISPVEIKYDYTYLNYIPLLFTWLNILLTLLLISLSIIKIKDLTYLSYICISISCWLANLLFLLFTSFIALRYQIFSLIICIITCYILIKMIWNKLKFGLSR